MVFKITNYICTYNQRQTSHIMMLVCLAALPAVAVQFWFFRWGVFFQIFLGCISALSAEALVLWLRKMTVMRILSDNSSILTGMLLAMSIPPMAPWWMVILGTIFAIIFAKQLYGGLGHNPFNPAMIGYVVLLVSFPAQMNSFWLLQYKIPMNVPSFTDTIQAIFFGNIFSFDDLDVSHIRIDGISQATPLNVFKTSIQTGYNVAQIMQHSIYDGIVAGVGWEWINLSWMFGGLFLLWKRVIHWHIPLSFLVVLFLCSSIGWILLPDLLANPKIHLLSGATMFGAFFILTDPVTASTTNRGRLIFGALAGVLVWLIRSFGRYPDGVAFSVLLANITAPIIDYFTCTRTHGYK